MASQQAFSQAIHTALHIVISSGGRVSPVYMFVDSGLHTLVVLLILIVTFGTSACLEIACKLNSAAWFRLEA